MATAIWIGRNRVDTNVARLATIEGQPARQTDRRSARLDRAERGDDQRPRQASASRSRTRRPRGRSRSRPSRGPQKIAVHREPRAGQDGQRRRAQRAPDRQAAEQARGDVRRTLADEVARDAPARAIGVRHALADPGTLDENDHRNRERAGDNVDRQAFEATGATGAAGPSESQPTSRTTWTPSPPSQEDQKGWYRRSQRAARDGRRTCVATSTQAPAARTADAKDAKVDLAEVSEQVEGLHDVVPPAGS